MIKFFDWIPAFAGMTNDKPLILKLAFTPPGEMEVGQEKKDDH